MRQRPITKALASLVAERGKDAYDALYHTLENGIYYFHDVEGAETARNKLVDLKLIKPTEPNRYMWGKEIKSFISRAGENESFADPKLRVYGSRGEKLLYDDLAMECFYFPAQIKETK